MGITRAEILRRSTSIWPKQGVPYSMATLHQPDGYRQDCSGYVSLCWAIPHSTPGSWGGMNTVSFVVNGLMKEIPQSELRPGDAIGKCGPGTAGADGHIMLWVGRSGAYHIIREQAGGVRGWRERTVSWPTGYKAYRFVGVTEDTLEEDMPMYGKSPGDDTVWAGDGVQCRTVSSEAGIVGGFASVVEYPSRAAMFDRLGKPLQAPVLDPAALKQAIADAMAGIKLTANVDLAAVANSVVAELLRRLAA